jgi:hypothetical protein
LKIGCPTNLISVFLPMLLCFVVANANIQHMGQAYKLYCPYFLIFLVGQ